MSKSYREASPSHFEEGTTEKSHKQLVNKSTNNTTSLCENKGRSNPTIYRPSLRVIYKA
ncbi:hypothetical protein [Mesoflavibacter sp. SCSIO 43206]|uniref:hypothetical protein n=1 Tax=Mesoflavibacter sp. SCSIO 43206 TaxID=2779362 RepID=UPI001CA81D7B|nr:hypothetical protein [Mesoflavibacter sp. SCSIO 43206]UAB74700.1 hypothetical protein INR78_09875 [Mesoflavibacter sp. SCSIO 43206]